MESNVYSTPESELKQPDEIQTELASRWLRFVAAFLDSMAITIFSAVLIFQTNGFGLMQSELNLVVIYSLLVGIANIGSFIVINSYLLYANGQTLGKKIVGIKIVTKDYKKAGIGHLSRRYGFYFFLAILPLLGPVTNIINVLFIFSESKRCLHDLVGGTCVVKA